MTSTADLEAARLLLSRLGASPTDRLTATAPRSAVPTVADYIPIVEAAVTAGTRRVYSTYWNRLVEHWGTRKLDEPTPDRRAIPDHQLAEINHIAATTGNDPALDTLILRLHTEGDLPPPTSAARRSQYMHLASRTSSPTDSPAISWETSAAESHQQLGNL